MTALTAVIITYNEAHNIGRCLNSLKGVADEIVVFDSNSTDNTREICESYGATVVKVQWRGYAKTKNEANAYPQHNYILWLDADEALSDKLSASILKEKENLSGIYSANRRNNYCGKWLSHGAYYPDKKWRLFPKDQVQWQGDFVHETLEISERLQQQHLQGDVLHYSYYTTAEHKARSKKYAALAATKLAQKNKFELILKLCFSPAIRFIKNYFFRLGFLDGWLGFQVNAITAYEVFLKYKMALQG